MKLNSRKYGTTSRLNKMLKIIISFLFKGNRNCNQLSNYKLGQENVEKDHTSFGVDVVSLAYLPSKLP